MKALAGHYLPVDGLTHDRKSLGDGPRETGQLCENVDLLMDLALFEVWETHPWKETWDSGCASGNPLSLAFCRGFECHSQVQVGWRWWTTLLQTVV